MKNMYDGVATLDANGETIVQMPDWFGALNRDFRYQLTVIGQFAQAIIKDKIANGQFRIMTRHLVPNSLGVVIVTATFSVADAILAVATLGFLGFGLQYPTFDWGDMLNNGISYMQDGYWWLVYPVGICIIVVVLACNVLGDALRDALDVRLRRR